MGTLQTFRLPIAPFKQNPRKIFVYLPDGYKESKCTYPVLYMFDGHNLFSDKTATYGKCWGIKEYLDSLHLPLVVIGQDCNHTGNRRLSEYCPVPVPEDSWIAPLKPCGEFTAEWFATVLKPECEKRFRIYKDRKHVGIGGSSMGGLMSIYCIARYNSVYGMAACVSSTMDINLQALLDTIDQSHISPDTKIYMDFGSNEIRSKLRTAEAIDNMLQINHSFQNKGCNTYPNLVVRGTHSEASWQTIVPLFLKYLYNLGE